MIIDIDDVEQVAPSKWIVRRGPEKCLELIGRPGQTLESLLDEILIDNQH